MNYKISYLLMRIFGIGGILVMLAGGLMGSTAVGLGGGLAVIAGVAQSSLFFCCPHCRRPFRVRDGVPTQCPYCQKKLE